jgi:hypothetical protein
MLGRDDSRVAPHTARKPVALRLIIESVFAQAQQPSKTHRTDNQRQMKNPGDARARQLLAICGPAIIPGTRESGRGQQPLVGTHPNLPSACQPESPSLDRSAQGQGFDV